MKLASKRIRHLLKVVARGQGRLFVISSNSLARSSGSDALNHTLTISAKSLSSCKCDATIKQRIANADWYLKPKSQLSESGALAPQCANLNMIRSILARNIFDSDKLRAVSAVHFKNMFAS